MGQNELLENNSELLYLSESFKFLGNSIKDESMSKYRRTDDESHTD